MENKTLEKTEEIARTMQLKTPEEVQEAKAEMFNFISQVNYILSRIRETKEGFMNTAPEVPNPQKKSVGRVLFPNPKLVDNIEIRKWLRDSWGEIEGDKVFNLMVEDGGGVHVFFQGVQWPCKGFNYNDTVECVDEVKKTAMAFLRGFVGGFEKSKVKMILFILFFRKQFSEIAENLLQELDYRMHAVKQKPERYCKSGREIYRVFNQMTVWYPDKKKILEELRNIVCMTWEYDDAYRYPGQDIFEEFDREKAKKDIIGELSKLIDIYISRDYRGTAQKFGRIKKLVYLLRFSKKYREMLRRFFLELDINRTKLDEADYYHAQYKWNYDWKVGKAHQRFQSIVNPDREPDEDMEEAKRANRRIIDGVQPV